MSNYPGIDYAGPVSQVNHDKDTGIRYGIIPLHALNEYVLESFEPDYGTPHCPKCGNPALDSGHDDIPPTDEREDWDYHGNDFACLDCKYTFWSDQAYGEEPIGNTLDDGTYQGNLDNSNDVWLFKSPYYTHAQFCSPCAPGAGYLANPCEDGPKTYCFGHDWFDGDRAPYPVYLVDTGELVPAPKDQGTDFPEVDKILNGAQS